MRAAQINQYGDQQVLQTTDHADRPKPAADQVLVAVHAAAVNPFDYKVRQGAAQLPEGVNFPATLGGDFAGTIAEIGEDVTGFAVGQAVYGQAGALSGHGSFAEFTPVKSTSVSAKPDSTDFVQAAAIPLVAVSAYQALVDHANLQAGQKILIHGGAGGIGSVAVQLAKHLGARVVATARGTDTDYVKQLGADEVIDYEHQDFTTSADDYDVVFDTVGGETNAKSYQVIKDGGAFVSMAAQADEAKVAEKHLQYTSQFTRMTPERLKHITDLVDADVITVKIDKVYPLEEAAAAVERVGTGHPSGKVVIQIAA